MSTPLPAAVPEADADDRRRRRRLAAVAVVVVSGLIGGALWWVRGTRDDDRLNTDAAIAKLLPWYEAHKGSEGPLSECPFGAPAPVIAAAPSDLGLGAAAAQGPAAELLPQGETLVVDCYQQLANGRTAGYFVADAFEENPQKSLVDGLVEYEMTFDDPETFRGGTVIPYCGTRTDDETRTFCAAEWYDDSVRLGVFINEDVDDTDLLIEWLEAALPAMVARIGRGG